MKASNTENERPCLVVSTANGQIERYPITSREVTIGRDPGNDICIDDPLVSKFHAKLLVANQSITVVDLESVNRTRVNGQVVAQETVRYGDEIQFARVRCQLVLATHREQEVSEGQGLPV